MSWTPNSDDVVYQDSFWGLVMAHQGTFIESGMTASVTGSDNTVSIASGVYYINGTRYTCLLYTSPSPRDKRQSRMPSSA